MSYMQWLNAILDRMEGLKIDARVTGIDFRRLFRSGRSIQEGFEFVVHYGSR